MKNNFENLIDRNKYQVFVMICPGSFPFSFAIHPWFVINKNGAISRFEVSHKKNQDEASQGHLNRNFLPPWQGLGIITFKSKPYHKAKLLALIAGDENSAARKMVDLIENSPGIYPYCDTYHFLGP